MVRNDGEEKMHWQFTPYTLPLLIAAAISAAVALSAWRRRSAPGAKALALLMLAVAEWSLGYALELGSADLPTKVFWARVQYLGIVILPVTWLAFALHYAAREQWLTTPKLALLAIEPLVVLRLVWTNDAHGLIWSSVKLDTSGSFSVLGLTYGVGFWGHVACSYLLLLLATFLLIQAVIRSPHLYRGQAGALLVGALAPWVGNALYLSGLSPFPYLDLTPFAFTLTGLAMVWGLSRFRLLDIVPVARDTVIEGMSDGVIVLDGQDRIVDLNPAAQQVIGRAATEIIGQPAAQVLSDWPDSSTELAKVLVERYRDVTEAHPEIVLGEGETQCNYDLRISPLHDRRGRLTGRLVVLRDITERKRAEEALRRAHDELMERTAQLQAANKELEAFAYSVSHDLRAPLRSINGFSLALLEDYADKLDKDGQDYLRRVRAASQRMAELIEALLQLSRLTRREMRRETVDLSQLVQTIAAELEQDELDRQVEFVIEEGVTASGDAHLLRVVLENLLGNAWKFTAKHPRARIEFGVSQHNGETTYFVRDDGAGFDMAYADRLFGAFQRLHLAGEFEGTGIGLATVQRIIHRHGGRVWAKGTLEQGATFYFTL